MMNLKSALMTGVLSGALLAVAPSHAAAAAIIDVTGSTLGCFGSGCSTFGSPAMSSSDYGLTFLGGAFDVDTNSSGTVSNINMGSIGRGNVNVSDSLSALPFTLQVTFTLPSGIVGGQQDTFTASIKGTNSGGGGAVTVDFDNTWQLFTYTNIFGSGSFEFAVINDLSVTKNTLTDPATILGGVRKATFTPNSNDLAAVPEPASLLLLGTGLAGVARMARRRR